MRWRAFILIFTCQILFSLLLQQKAYHHFCCMMDSVFGLLNMAVNTCFNQSFRFKIQNLQIISHKYYRPLLPQSASDGFFLFNGYFHSYHIAKPLKKICSGFQMLFCRLLYQSILSVLVYIFEAWLLVLSSSCFILSRVNFP